MKMKKLNEKGVSQIVSVLVLTAVVIVGAIGAGVIMNTFSNEVADSTSAEGIGDGAAAELLIAGSTTVQPVSECLADKYMNVRDGVRVTVQGGGSGSGVATTGLNVVDIGSASRYVKDSEQAKFPDIQTHQIGGSAVVVITNTGSGVDTANLSELMTCYDDDTGTPCVVNGSGTPVTVNTVYQRSESSGTEDTFADWIPTFVDGASDTEGAVGNAGVLAEVEDCPTAVCLGFVDFGYADSSDDVDIVGVSNDGSTYYTPDGGDVEDALGGDASAYLLDLTRPLNYLTNGDPSTVEADYLKFARSPGQADCFAEVGYIPYFDFA